MKGHVSMIGGHVGLLTYVAAGILGGLLGVKIRIPSGALIGSMLAVIAVKLLSDSNWTPPRYYEFLVQVLIGVMIGATIERGMLSSLSSLAVPILVSTLVLVGAGMIVCAVFYRMGVIDLTTGYLGTSPGAISVLVVLAAEKRADPAIVLTFHFVRVVFVVLTAPWIVKLLGMRQ